MYSFPTKASIAVPLLDFYYYGRKPNPNLQAKREFALLGHKRWVDDQKSSGNVARGVLELGVYVAHFAEDVCRLLVAAGRAMWTVCSGGGGMV